MNINKLKTAYAVIFVFFSYSIAWASCTGSSPARYAASASYSDVKACYDVAVTGDTINVPAGSATWSSTMEVEKHISIIGGYGGGTTTIISGIKPVMLINPITTNNSLLRVSNFIFNNNGVTSGGLDGTVNFGWHMTKGTTMVDQVRLDHCTFLGATGYGALFVYASFYGVVDHCIFGSASSPIDNGYAMFVMGWSDTNNDWWSVDPTRIYTLGSEKFIYFEDNIFYLHSNNNQRIAASQYGSRAAYRYNTINGGCSDGEWELHGFYDGASSVFGFEVYGNDIKVSNITGSSIKIRGGSSLIFYNTRSGSGSTITGLAYSDVGISGPAKCCAPVSPELQSVHDTYWFNNRAGYNGALGYTTGTADLDGCGIYDDRPLRGRDIIDQTSTPASVEVGTSRPGTCTTGSAYWETSQSTTDLTNLVGDINTNPSRATITGTLYKCTETNVWTSFYTPYTYPHPLRSESYGSVGGGVTGAGFTIR